MYVKDRHDKTIDVLVDRLKKKHAYSVIKKNEIYFGEQGVFCRGEVDVMAKKRINGKRHLLLFDVQKYHSVKAYHKAIEFLNNHEEHYKNIHDRCFKFYVSYDENIGVIIKWVK